MRLLAAALLLAASPVPADPYAALVRATVPVRAERPTNVDLLVDGARAAIRVRVAGRETAFQALDTPDAILIVLADPKLSGLWPALLTWAGPDLERFRAREVERARLAYEAGVPGGPARTTSEGGAEAAARSALQYAGVLWNTGSPRQALAVLDRAAEIAAMRGADDPYDQIMLLLRRAALETELAGPDAAARLLDSVRSRFADPRYAGYALNIDVNRAAFLAEAGRHAEALATIDAARRAYDGAKRISNATGDSAKIAGSDRQFGWIRACALHGLGRRAEAEAALRPVFAAKEPVDEYFRIPASESLQLRGLACMGDVERSVDVFEAVARRSPVAAPLVALMRPEAGVGRRPGFDAAVRAHPRIVALLAERTRPLPAELQPALRRWR